MEPSLPDATPLDPTPSRERASGQAARVHRFESLPGAVVSVLCAAVALTCAGQRAVLDTRSEPVAQLGAPSAAGIRDPVPSAPEVRPVPDGIESTEPHPLDEFRRALRALARAERPSPVRVLWLGDSHTAADYMTGAVRSALEAVSVPGGPGFLRVGLTASRHDRATVQRSGRFRVEPEPPSRRAAQDDGVFGLGGVRATALDDAARITLKVAPGALRGRARYTVMFQLPEAAAFEAVLGGQTVQVPGAQGIRHVPESPITRLELEGAAEDELLLHRMRGQPRFYGVIVEGSEHGLVLDTAGIDGARLATALAWAEGPFIAEVAARRPDLFVLAYGTNEAFDGLRVQAYAGELLALLNRLRRGAPSAACLVIGPPDALDRSGAPLARVAEIANVYQATARETGCAFLSAQALMGGPGGFLGWLKQNPALARADRIHLTAAGYRTLGAGIAGELLGDASGAAAAGGTSPAATNAP